VDGNADGRLGQFHPEADDGRLGLVTDLSLAGCLLLVGVVAYALADWVTGWQDRDALIRWWHDLIRAWKGTDG
jgi:hypothetical protein